MSVSDPIADMLTKLRNAGMAKHEKVDVPPSKLKQEIVKILKSEGYIKNFRVLSEKGEDVLRVYLKYDETSAPVIHGLRKLSKPGRRRYSGYKEMPRVFNGYGTLIVSTSVGVTTGRKAVEQKAGGELICSVW